MQRILLVVLAACDGKEPGTKDGPVDPTDPPPATDACEPTLTLASEPVVEGDTVEVTLACSSGVSGPDYVPTLAVSPENAVFDDATWKITFTTDLDDAGPHTLGVTFDVAGGLPESAELVVWVNDAGPGVDGNVAPDPDDYTQEFGLPVIWCDPPGAVGASLGTASCRVDGLVYASSRMKTEGPAYPKPSYVLDFGVTTPMDGESLDMHNKETLALLTTFDDNSYVRQKLAHDLWKDLEDYWDEASPQGVDRPHADTSFVVLYLRGEYQGLYVATDPVDGELMDEQGLDPREALYRSVSDDADFYPKADITRGWVEVQGAAGDAEIEDLLTWAALATPAEFEVEAESRIRVDEFIDWYLLASFVGAPGSAGNRAYLYNDPAVAGTDTGDDPGLPGWRYIPGDYVGSFGQDVNTERVAVSVVPDLRAENRLFSLLLDSNQLSGTMGSRYFQTSQAGGPFDTAAIVAHLDEYYLEIDHAARRDEARWSDEYATWFAARGAPLPSYADEREAVYAWVDGRLAAYDAARAF